MLQKLDAQLNRIQINLRAFFFCPWLILFVSSLNSILILIFDLKSFWNSEFVAWWFEVKISQGQCFNLHLNLNLKVESLTVSKYVLSSLWNTRLMGHFWLLLQLYGGVYNLFRSGLPRMGIDVTMVDIFDLNDLKKCLRSQTKLVWLEACTNPLVMLADLGRDHLLSFWPFVAPVYDSTSEICVSFIP